MLVDSKYLEEVGYQGWNLLPRDDDERFMLNKEYGVVEAETWSLYETIILELYVYLRYFQDECWKGIPGNWVDGSKKDRGLSDWRNALQEMIDGLKAYLTALEVGCEKEQKKQLLEKFNKGWKLLGDNMGCLWW